MPIEKPHSWTKAIAYTRVSTDSQGRSGVGLEGQTIAINEYASHAGLKITERFQDVGSGWGDDNLKRREGLQNAIAIAKAVNLPIIVSDVSRISRKVQTIFDIAQQHGITIISSSHGAMTSPAILASNAARAEYDRRMISELTRAALQERKRQGVKLGNRKNLPEAQRKGVATNQAKADALVAKIADVLEPMKGNKKLSARQVVDLLNDRGIYSGRGNPWTISAVRRPLARAQKLLQSRADARAKKPSPDFGRF